MSGITVAQTKAIQKVMMDATNAGGALMLEAVSKSVEALKQGFAEASLDPAPVAPAVTIAATLDTVLALLADIKAEHVKG